MKVGDTVSGYEILEISEQNVVLKFKFQGGSFRIEKRVALDQWERENSVDSSYVEMFL